MENPRFVSSSQGSSHLTDNFGSLLKRHSFGRDQSAQRDAVDVLHDDVRLPILRHARVEYAHNVWMIDSRERLDLLLEFFCAPLVLFFVIAHHLNHYLARDHLLIRSQIDCAEAPLSQLSVDEIAAFENHAD